MEPKHGLNERLMSYAFEGSARLRTDMIISCWAHLEQDVKPQITKCQDHSFNQSFGSVEDHICGVSPTTCFIRLQHRAVLNQSHKPVCIFSNSHLLRV
eukprot:5577341-Amphidinium_carterae.1